MTDIYKKFDELLEYPTVLDFRVIVDSGYANALEEVVALINKIEQDTCKGQCGDLRHSSNGKYISYTLPTRVLSTHHVERVYKEVAALSFVKHIV